MRGVIGALAALLAVVAFAQEATDYTTAENPFQAEYTFESGRPIVLRVNIQGVLVDTLTLTAPSPLPSDDEASCTVELVGSREGGGKATVTAVLLLEDDQSQSLHRLTLDEFKVRSGRSYVERQEHRVPTAALAAAARVYVFIKVD